jgi:DNA (cytosine-5)-methyltransferase 1
MSLTYTDIFCGAGGSSLGLTGAGLELRLAANHWDRAIATHAANFRDAEHLCADVSNYDMRRLPATDVLWASPICTEISPAGGRRRRGTQLDMLEEAGHVAKAGMDRTRATFHDVIRATEVHRYTAVLVENVVEAAEWELFDWWVSGMDLLGYVHQFVSVSSAHVGGPGNPHAPQWRDRLYIVFTRIGVPLPDVAPRPLARCPACGVDVAAVQSWKNDRRRRIGKYRQQYVYRCPNSGCRHAVVEPYVLPAAAAIDWTDLGQRIGDRTRPLAAATLRRIRAGLELFAEPTVVRACGGDPDGSASLRAWPAAGGPLGARLTSGVDGIATRAATGAFLTPAGGTWNDTPTAAGEPMRTRTTRDTEALVLPPSEVPPFVTMLRRNGETTGFGEPLATMAAAGNHHALTVPPGAFYVKHFTPRGDWGQMSKDARVEPLGSITGADHHSLVVPYRRGPAKTTDEPLHTLATRDSAALLRTDLDPGIDPGIDLDDCRFRMLKPREHLRAQRFPDTYTVTGNQGEQTMQAGNAVSANVAHWLGRQVAAALDTTAADAAAPPRREAA